MLAGDYEEGVRLTLLGLQRSTSLRDEKAAHSNLCAGYLVLGQLETALGIATGCCSATTGTGAPTTIARSSISRWGATPNRGRHSPRAGTQSALGKTERGQGTLSRRGRPRQREHHYRRPPQPSRRYAAVNGIAVSLLLLSLLSTDTGELRAAVSDAAGGRMALHTVAPKYPRKARRDRIEGRVTVCFDVDREGRPRRIAVRHSSHRYFREALAQSRARVVVSTADGR